MRFSWPRKGLQVRLGNVDWRNEGFHERDDRRAITVGKIQKSITSSSTFAVVHADGFQQGGRSAIVHVGCRVADAPQRRCSPLLHVIRWLDVNSHIVGLFGLNDLVVPISDINRNSVFARGQFLIVADFLRRRSFGLSPVCGPF